MPRNAKKAITPEFYRYFPAGQSRSYGSYYFERNGGRNLLAAAADTDQREIQQVTIQAGYVYDVLKWVRRGSG